MFTHNIPLIFLRLPFPVYSCSCPSYFSTSSSSLCSVQLCMSHLFHAGYMPRPSHPPWFHRPNNIRWRVKIMRPLITQFFRPPVTSCYILCLVKFFPQHFLSGTLRSSLVVTLFEDYSQEWTKGCQTRLGTVYSIHVHVLAYWAEWTTLLSLSVALWVWKCRGNIQGRVQVFLVSL
jgi:hypothetical protein